MNNLEKKAVADLKELISKIEKGEFKITDCGMMNKSEYSNVTNENGKIKRWDTSYHIYHYEN